MFYCYGVKWNPMRPAFYPYGKMIIIGHRGAPVLAPENTLESFEEAFKTDIKGVELDVQISKDGELVVYHDWNLGNITDSLQNIDNLNYSEIQDFSQKNNYHIPLLSEVLGIFPKDKFINIEIKSQHYSNTLLIKKIVKMIWKYKLETCVVVSSFNPFVLQYIKKKSPTIPTAYLWSSEDALFLFNSPLWIWICRPDGFHINIENVDENIVRWARKNNLSIFAFTINSASELFKAQELKLDGIFTNDPYLNTSSSWV